MIRPFLQAFGLVLTLVLTLALASGAMAQTATEPPTLSARELKALAPALSRGGYVLYFRHLDTAHDQEDQQPVDLNDCRKQRNLSPEGIARGRAIATAFRKLRLRFGEVIASPFCRTMDSAKLLAARATADSDLFFAIALSAEDKARKGAALRKLAGRVPAKGTSTLIVGHTANLQEAFGLWPKPEGVAYLLQPDAAGGVRVLGRIEPATWEIAAR